MIIMNTVPSLTTFDHKETKTVMSDEIGEKREVQPDPTNADLRLCPTVLRTVGQNCRRRLFSFDTCTESPADSESRVAAVNGCAASATQTGERQGELSLAEIPKKEKICFCFFVLNDADSLY